MQASTMGFEAGDSSERRSAKNTMGFPAQQGRVGVASDGMALGLAVGRQLSTEQPLCSWPDQVLP